VVPGAVTMPSLEPKAKITLRQEARIIHKSWRFRRARGRSHNNALQDVLDDEMTLRF
jgi:hypothetical protein